MKNVLLSCLLFCCTQLIANQQPISISQHIDFYQQDPKLKFFDSNQVVIKSSTCLAIFDASGDFEKAEQFADSIKATYQAPVCYLIASHGHDDHLLGMAMLQAQFPKAQLVTHLAIAENFSKQQQALANKLAKFNQSIELSEKRLPKLQEKQQQEWQKRIKTAKKRLARWQTLTLDPPAVTIDKNTVLQLGEVELQILPTKVHSGTDLLIYLAKDKVLLGGDVVDQMPYLGEANIPELEVFLNSLKTLEVDTIIPGHGDKFTLAELDISLFFVSSLLNYSRQTIANDWSLERAQNQFDHSKVLPKSPSELETRAAKMFVNAALKNLYQASEK